MGKLARELSQTEAEALAFDVAVGYFDAEQLQRRYSISEAQLDRVLSQDAFLRFVDEQKRAIEEDGESFKLRARTAALKVIDSMERIAQDHHSPGTARVKAGEVILKAAGYEYMKPQQAAAQQIQPITIQTNLALGQQPKGTYTLEAKAEPEPEVLEAPRYAEEPGADLV